MTLDTFLTSWNDSTDHVLVHTSGSTGKPKPMFVEKKRMLSSARMTCDFLGLLPGDLAFLCKPLDYIAGKMMVVRSIERQLELQVVEPTGHPLKGITVDSNRHSLAAMVPLQ
ncbi:MAG: O-succinylbenzoic acid--CoA ligase, partial [Prevotella salivae]|nr:O-succinylbenzoic acid--CoA ligase [Segatella salivae]